MRTVAIIGRPNVGKSTLFNRLVGKRLALVDDMPGVTRDRREGDARLGDLKFRIFDTAGLEDAKGEKLEARMRVQTEAAIGEADVCLFMIDARAGVTPLDTHFAEILRRQAVPLILLANKCEGQAGEPGYLEAFGLGLGDPVPVSAEHGEGLGDLYTALRAAFDLDGDGFWEQDEDEAPAPDKPLQIAICGRPNVGKSTLVNTMLGEERMLTGPEAGITRDSISVPWEWQDRALRVFDTAGMRRRARVTGKLEKLSVADTLRAVRFAEVAVLLLDAQAPFEKQDLHIADLVIKEGRGLVIGLNKWDLVENRQEMMKEILIEVDRLLPQVRGVPVVPLSAERGTGLDKLMASVFDVYDIWNKRVSTADLNRWLEGALERHPPPAVSGRRLRIRYITQVKSRPPTFAAFTTRPDDLPDAYTRYLINGIRDSFDLPAVPIRLHYRKRKNPYADS